MNDDEEVGRVAVVGREGYCSPTAAYAGDRDRVVGRHGSRARGTGNRWELTCAVCLLHRDARSFGQIGRIKLASADWAANILLLCRISAQDLDVAHEALFTVSMPALCQTCRNGVVAHSAREVVDFVCFGRRKGDDEKIDSSFRRCWRSHAE